MGMTSSGNKAVNAEINVTPLIDVLLALLIIFMVIVPTAARGLDALIPQPAKPTEHAVVNTPIVVQVLGDSERGVSYKINEVSFDKADVEAKLASIFAGRSEKTMFVKGDAGLEFSAVAGVIDSGHRAGVENIGIITGESGSLR
jgi:biopolymer transport protein TolR